MVKLSATFVVGGGWSVLMCRNRPRSSKVVGLGWVGGSKERSLLPLDKADQVVVEVCWVTLSL